jgi:hypothetical protein
MYPAPCDSASKDRRRRRSSHLDLAMIITTGFAFYFRCAQKIAVGSSPPLSKQQLRLVIRYNYNGIAIKAFKRSRVRVQAGRIDADKHWGAAVWARMNFNFV